MNIVKALELVIEEAEFSLASKKEVSIAKNSALVLCKEFLEFTKATEDSLSAKKPDFTPDPPKEKANEF